MAPQSRTTGSAGFPAAADEVDVIVVGGGVVGAASAYWLARAGVQRVVLVERDDLAGGSSGKPLGGVRAVFSQQANVELALRSREFYRTFTERTGRDIGWRNLGYLFALRTVADVTAYEASVELQNSLGVRSRMVSPRQAHALSPYLDPDRLRAGVWSPDDGIVRPRDVVRGLGAAAAGLGVQVVTGAEVVGLDAVGGERAAVTLASGHRFTAQAVVCAAGAWSARLGAMVGVDLPVVPRRRQIVVGSPRRRPPGPAAGVVPFTIDQSTTAYVHSGPGDSLVLGWADPGQPDGHDRTVTDDWHDGLREALRQFAPALAGIDLTDGWTGWAGLYELTPDCNALVGQTHAPGFRFLYATGFSGHGLLQAPAAGECVRDLYLDRDPVVDTAAFAADRFARPAARTEIGII
ncbi:NAD(P)/FAD-dependent oxidoreductase [Kineococcus sp. SYSU DK003]|uniref:NAD(P)/FAD-dependent oxidoreductase n=1 Tax=Kineococcus sp. SYSU DK003 TaxID=3383124 RepID=UPI003D7C62AF